MPSSRVRRTAAALAAAGLLAAGCGTGSVPSPVDGVDELVIPTPSPEQSDFVATPDNPWLALTGATPGPVIDGVATTTRVAADPVTGEPVDDHLAQDRAGNVWWFGRDDVTFAEPGLAMPADPRLGDGFRMTPTATALVVDVDRSVDPALVVLAVTESGRTHRQTYEYGVGLVNDDGAEPSGSAP